MARYKIIWSYGYVFTLEGMEASSIERERPIDGVNLSSKFFLESIT